ncbi:MAG: cyclic pyranopterin monophosphate synthase MoaC [Neisseria sp.]|nr:cyclic pyranopterin monophosphate synthase MoaC [Neisseria sp.]
MLELADLNNTGLAAAGGGGDSGRPPLRTAIARGYINFGPAVLAILDDPAQTADILAVARVSAIQNTKQTGYCFPLRQPAPLKQIRIEFDIDRKLSRIQATATVSAEHGGSVETEAVYGAGMALMTIYDILKNTDRTMTLTQIHLVEEHGGQQGTFIFADEYENLNL